MSTKITTHDFPEFRVLFPSVFEPKQVKGTDKHAYSVLALFEPNTDLSFLRKIELLEAKAKWNDKAEMKLGLKTCKRPLRLQDELVNQKTGELYSGCVNGAWCMSLTSELPVDIRDAYGRHLLDPTAIYSGCYAKAVVEAYAYDNVAFGVKFRLMGIMKTRDGERLGGFAQATDDDYATTATSPFDDEMPF